MTACTIYVWNFDVTTNCSNKMSQELPICLVWNTIFVQTIYCLEYCFCYFTSDSFFKFRLNTYCLSILYAQQGSLQDPTSTVRQIIMKISHLAHKINTELLQFYIYSYIDIFS